MHFAYLCDTEQVQNLALQTLRAVHIVEVAQRCSMNINICVVVVTLSLAVMCRLSFLLAYLYHQTRTKCW